MQFRSRRIHSRLAATLAIAMLAIPTAARACAVCFGGEDSDWPAAFNLGVVVLLAMPFLIVGGAGLAIYRSIKQKEAQAAASEQARS